MAASTPILLAMRTRALTIVALLAAAPCAASEPVRAPVAATEAPVLLRLSPDGEYLGAIRADGNGAEILVAPLQPALRAGAMAPLTIGGLFAVPAGDGPRVIASASRRQSLLMAAPALPPAWCQGVIGLVAHATECALQATPVQSPQPALSRQSAGIGWQAGVLELALAGSSLSGWSAGPIATLPAAVLAGWDGPSLLAPMGLVDTRDASVAGLWRIAPWGGVTLGATVGETQWQVLPGTAPLALDQAAVQLGLVYGPFSGGITGRALRPTQGLDGTWTGLDIGFAWRTPWRGELSVGAQNLIGRGNGALPAPAAPVLDEATARTPYVRYTQDL
jgi:hypothetical protein